MCSGDEGHARVGVGEHFGRGPSVDDANDELTAAANESSRGVEQPHRSVLGRAFFQGPLRQSSWNQRTRSPDRHTTNSQTALAVKLVNGIEVRPESFSRWMWFSTCACARIVASSSRGSLS